MEKSFCQQFHEFLEEYFDCCNFKIWRDTEKVKPQYYCKNNIIPTQRVDKDSQEYIIVHKMYLNGYPNGSGKREIVDPLMD